MRSSNWIASALLLSGLTAFAAQPAWVHEKGNGQIELKDPANQKRTVLTLHAPGKVTVGRLKTAVFRSRRISPAKSFPESTESAMGKRIHLTFSGSWKASGLREFQVAHLCFLWIRVSEGKYFFSLEENGKQSALFLPQEKNLTKWLRPPFNRRIVQRIDVPLSAGHSGSTEQAVKSPAWFTATTAAISVSSRKTANCRERLRFSISRSSLLRSIFPRRQTVIRR